MPITIDLGNTFVKWVEWDPEKNVKNEFLFSGIYDCLRWLDGNTSFYDNIYISSVIDLELEKKLFEKLSHSGEIKFFHSEMKMPFSVHYTPVSSLGTDRLLGILGAWYLWKGRDAVVIDAGTCIKYSMLSSEKGFMGGWITPGLMMRFKAMHHFTSRLPLLEPDVIKNAFYPPTVGTTTQSSMSEGTVAGLCMEITGLTKHAISLLKNPVIVLTGGDMKVLSSRLLSENGLYAVCEKKQIFTEPLLIHKALLNYFETKW